LSGIRSPLFSPVFRCILAGIGGEGVDPVVLRLWMPVIITVVCFLLMFLLTAAVKYWL